MSVFQPKTLSMASGIGALVSFASGGVGVCSVLARAECYVAPVGVATNPAPAAPSQTPAPALQGIAGYIHMLAGEIQVFGADPGYNALGGAQAPADMIGWLQVWPVAAGDLVINAH